MSARILSIAAAAVVGLSIGMVPLFDASLGQPAAPPATELRPPSAFAGITDPQARSVALFQEAGKVITHARCVNCHPAAERPLQTDRMRPHQPLVVRGADGHGAPGMLCATCHGPANFDPARVPGHPEWHLAPASMSWEGRSLGQICEQIKDPGRNGGKDMAALLHHMAEDSLVGWAWSPGPGRTPAPGTQAGFGELLRAWADAGAHCP
jgi:mono/diheme cytochrome c family protein